MTAKIYSLKKARLLKEIKRIDDEFNQLLEYYENTNSVYFDYITLHNLQKRISQLQREVELCEKEYNDAEK